MTTKLIIVRHCEAEGNKYRTFQGHTDSEISDKGKIQLDLLSVRCRNMHIDALYSSPLKRAYATAEAVNRFHHLPIQIEPGLIEINGGEWEGEKWVQLPDLYPEQAHNWNCAPWDFKTEKGESMRQVYNRVWDAACRIVKANPDKTVCIASHGCAIRNLLCHCMNKPIEELNTVDWVDNTGISIVDFDEDMNPHIELLNDASHLSEETSTFATQSWWKPENRETGRFD